MHVQVLQEFLHASSHQESNLTKDLAQENVAWIAPQRCNKQHPFPSVGQAEACKAACCTDQKAAALQGP